MLHFTLRFCITVFLTDVVSVIPRKGSAVVHARLAYLALPSAANKCGVSFFQSADHALALARYTGKAHVRGFNRVQEKSASSHAASFFVFETLKDASNFVSDAGRQSHYNRHSRHDGVHGRVEKKTVCTHEFSHYTAALRVQRSPFARR
jgi:hypothetical protein